MKLFKKKKIWWVDYTADGVRHRQSTGTSNKAAAETWMQNIQLARRMPTFESAVEVLRVLYAKPAKGAIGLDAIHEVYERLASATGRDAVSAETVRKRRNFIERFIRWLRAKRPMVKTAEEVNGPVAAGFAEALKDEGLKTKTRRNIIGELSSVWKMLEKASTGVRNPWTALQPADTDGERGKAFTLAQEEAVLEAAKAVGKDWWPICVIMRHTGLRYGDVARLKWSEISADWILRHTPEKTKRHNIEVVLPLIAPVRAAIETLERRGDWLFPLHAELYGRRGAQTSAGLIFAEVLEAAGVEGRGYTIHSWRHTAATRLAEAGADIETRKRLLGHTVDATAERYDHASHLAEAREALEAATRRDCGKSSEALG